MSCQPLLSLWSVWPFWSVCVVSLLVAGPGLARAESPATQPARIDVQAFERQLDQPDTVVLDVRTPREFASGHVPEAVHLDVQSPDFAEKVAALDKEKTYLVYCRTGRRSDRAAEVMRRQQFRDVQVLSGGIIAWEDAGKPTRRGPATAPAK